ncbi:MAG: molybdate ABC transporter substrate-binding protein [Phycisphaerales bacterium]|nr:molybdate ABC transporter substrate-binding protein [Phycisphaerales bacterium]
MLPRLRSLCAPGVLLCLCPLLNGCDRPAPGNELRVFAASSLVDVFAEAAPAFEAEHPGARVTTSTAGSQILAAQLLEGADPDIFASADQVQMHRVASLFETPVDFAANRLVIVATPDADVNEPADLTRPGLRVVVASAAVPAGRYANEVLGRLGLLESVETNIVSYEHSVRGVLMKVLLGEADAGLVYATDAASVKKGALSIVEFPQEAAVRATCPIAVHTDARDPALARSFVEFMLTGDGATILRRHGFETP